jgi:predicted site-specific integrase-resolvase
LNLSDIQYLKKYKRKKIIIFNSFLIFSLMDIVQYAPASIIQKRFKVCNATLIRWVETGIVGCRCSPGGKRFYNVSDIEKAFGLTEEEKRPAMSIRYARVSSSKQKKDLETQITDLETLYPDCTKTISDVGSSLNWSRKGLLSLLELVSTGGVQRVVVMHKDRLCRFGSELLEWIFKKNGCKLVVHSKAEGGGCSENELAEDLLAITTIFVAKHHGRRAAENKRRRAGEETCKETENSENKRACRESQEN